MPRIVVRPRAAEEGRQPAIGSEAALEIDAERAAFQSHREAIVAAETHAQTLADENDLRLGRLPFDADRAAVPRRRLKADGPPQPAVRRRLVAAQAEAESRQGLQRGARRFETRIDAGAGARTRLESQADLSPQLRVSVSIGVCEAQPGDTPASLLRRSDAAMFKEKARSPARSDAVEDSSGPAPR
jgi:GGDEF domain-containing protein